MSHVMNIHVQNGPAGPHGRNVPPTADLEPNQDKGLVQGPHVQVQGHRRKLVKIGAASWEQVDFANFGADKI